MKNEIITRFLEFHAGGDDKLQINFAWPNVFPEWHSYYLQVSICTTFLISSNKVVKYTYLYIFQCEINVDEEISNTV